MRVAPVVGIGKVSELGEDVRACNDGELCDTLPIIPTTSENVAVIVVALAEDEETDEPHGCNCKNVEKLFHANRTERDCFYCERGTRHSASSRKAVVCFQVGKKEKRRINK